MDSKTTAEFRLIDKEKIPLLSGSHTKQEVIVKKRFLSKKISYKYIDTFDSFLDSETELLGSLSGQGFLMLSDIIKFLKCYKNIDLETNLYNEVVDKLLEREETAYFLDYLFVQDKIKQLDKIEIKDEELIKFARDTDGMEEVEHLWIPFKKDQLKDFIKAIKMTKPNRILYLRGTF